MQGTLVQGLHGIVMKASASLVMSPPDLCLVAAAWLLLALVHISIVWALFYMVSTARPNATQRSIHNHRSQLHTLRTTTQRPMHNHRSQHEDHHHCSISGQTWHAFRNGPAFVTAEDCLELHDHYEKEQSETTFQIFLKLASRQSITVDVRPSDTIGHVKRMVEDAEGIPADALLVVCGGKQREDHDTVASLNIKQEVTVHVTCRLHGGTHGQTMNSIPLKHVPRAISRLLDEYHRTQRKKKITKTSWKDLTSSDLQAVVRAVDPDSATAYKIPCVSELFLSDDPDVALSYRWTATLGDMYDGLCTTCSPDETVWIDILFNAQNAELTPEAVLELTPKRYQNAKRHLLLVTSTQDLVALLGRGWICFEIAVRMISDKPMVELVDPHSKASELYQSGGLSRDFFKAMETLDPQDTILIQGAIRQLFTRGDVSYLAGADPVLNFNRGVRDFVHLTGGKLFIIDLANQSCWQRVTEEAWTLSDEMESRAKFSDCLFVRERLLTALQHVHGHEHPDVAGSLVNLGNVRQEQGDFGLALANYEQALPILRRTLGDEHPDVAASLSNIGNVYERRGEFELALAKYEQALAIDIKHRGHEHLDIATSLVNLGNVHQAQGELGLALVKYEQALPIMRRTLGDEHLDVANDEYNLALAKRQQGQAQEASALFRHCAQVYAQAYGPDHEETIDALKQADQ